MSEIVVRGGAIQGDASEPRLMPFAIDIQTAPQTFSGYDYHYIPLPLSCTEPQCTRFTLSAIPRKFGKTGRRSFFIDESGTMRHCVGRAGVDATDSPLDESPKECNKGDSRQK